MLGRERVEDGGCERLHSNGGAGILYRRPSWFNDSKSMGGGLRQADCCDFKAGGHGGRSRAGSNLGGGVCECATRAGIRGRISTEREGIGALGRRNGDHAGEICGSGGGSFYERADL